MIMIVERKILRNIMNILLLDDDSEMVSALSEVLELDDHRVQCGYNGRDGLAQLQSGEALPDVIVCDISMPLMNGLAFTRHLRQDELLAGIPVVMMSGRSDDEAAALEAGATYFIAKPFHYPQLEQILLECQKR